MPPPVVPGFEHWIDAFYDLSTDRQLGQVIGPIPDASIVRHPENVYRLFKRCIRAMDDVYLRHVRSGGMPDAPETDNDARDSFRRAMRATE